MNERIVKVVYCDFCGKNQYQVRYLVAKDPVFICIECIDLCKRTCDAIHEEEEREKQVKSS